MSQGIGLAFRHPKKINIIIMKRFKLILSFLPVLFISLGTLRANSYEISDSVPKFKVHYIISFNCNYTKNKIEHLMFTSNNSLMLTRGAFGITQAVNYQYSLLRSPLTAPRVNLLNETQLSTKFHYEIGKFGPMVLAGYEKSRYRSIDNRYFAIAGADYKLINTKYNHFSPLLGLSAESSYYLDKTNYKNLFYCIGLRGLHELPKNRLKIMYNGYFFKLFNENRWRYQGVMTAMVQVIKPLYATFNINASEEKIIKSNDFRKLSTVSFGLTYKL